MTPLKSALGTLLAGFRVRIEIDVRERAIGDNERIGADQRFSRLVVEPARVRHTLVPHSEQNFESSSCSAPHSPQNFVLASF